MKGFGNLYYTDCRPGQGLQGSAGFQFQAASSGEVAAAAMPLVQRSALYEPPASWMQERRPVADYPLSLTHACDGTLVATAAGRYLGQEANGTRQGNQFTHAVATRDGADYGLARPAQLWAADWWAAGPAEGTVLDPIPAHPATGPLDTETVRDRVRDTPGGKSVLVALLSALHRLADQEGRRKVVLVAANPEVAACWIAAATLLLPRSQALRTTFKIFVADAQYGQHDIIAVHPEWAGRWADIGAGTGLAVFDLDRIRHSPMEPTESALFWVPHFLEEDAYDVVDAVELAGQWAQAADAQPTAADRTVALVVASGARLTRDGDIEAAAEWLREGPEEAMDIAREPVLDAVLETRPTAGILRTLAEAAGQRGWTVQLAIQRGLCSAEIREVREAPDPVAMVGTVKARTPLRWTIADAAAETARRDEIEEALRGAPREAVPALLTLARRHGVDPRPDRFPDTVRPFTVWWIRVRDERLDPERWPSDKALTWVRTELEMALARGGKDAGEADMLVRNRWWRALLPLAARPTTALDGLLFGCAYARLDGPERDKVAKQVLRRVAQDQPQGTAGSEAAWRVLFDGARPSVDEIATFLDGCVEHRLPLSPTIAKPVCAILDGTGFSPLSLRIARELRRLGHPLSREQLRQLDHDDQIARNLRAFTSADPAGGKGLALAIDAAPEKLIAVRAGSIVDALVAAPLDQACDVLVGRKRAKLGPIYTELKGRWLSERTVVADADAIAFTFLMTGSKPGDHDQELDFMQIRHLLGTVVARMSKEDRGTVERVGDLGPAWATWVGEIEPKGFLSRHLGRSGKRHSKED